MLQGPAVQMTPQALAAVPWMGSCWYLNLQAPGQTKHSVVSCTQRTSKAKRSCCPVWQGDCSPATFLSVESVGWVNVLLGELAAWPWLSAVLPLYRTNRLFNCLCLLLSLLPWYACQEPCQPKDLDLVLTECLSHLGCRQMLSQVHLHMWALPFCC